jgi:hypothetical protein
MGIDEPGIGSFGEIKGSDSLKYNRFRPYQGIKGSDSMIYNRVRPYQEVCLREETPLLRTCPRLEGELQFIGFRLSSIVRPDSDIDDQIVI